MKSFIKNTCSGPLVGPSLVYNIIEFQKIWGMYRVRFMKYMAIAQYIHGNEYLHVHTRRCNTHFVVLPLFCLV